ncbi:plasmid pRiA4b ORF-3 family protein [Bacteroidia bacterium]|jgi:hypothetical protein|nr:plasmid pRiA4b ORF-3 family protein [Bacteroidia bacterium]
MIYRFKIRFEDEEDFVSIVEVNTKHSFFHLHDIMQTAIGFNKKQDASIFTSNDNWKPLKEFSIPSNYNELIEKGEKLPLISAHIFDPYQKFIYIADKENEWVLEVELMRIADDEQNVKYPNVKRTEGFPPRQFVAEPIIDDEPSADIVDELAAMPSFDSIVPNLDKDKTKTENSELDEFPDLGDIDEIDFSEEL